MNVLDTYRGRVKDLEKEVADLRPRSRELAVQSLILELIAAGGIAFGAVMNSKPMFGLGAAVLAITVLWLRQFARISLKIHELTLESASIQLALNLAIHIAVQNNLESAPAEEGSSK